ncbi:Multisite-specific tRNA:(cytosine-C(5))-methyltransferase [Candida viswanathii]|uniref:Multisite-specific tRNA:(Cytosine-C(5))-methyltransferase n=1 Tax=Candida viswanathii TaxID=5486 RepID=A0A367YAN6_9ASCO|nr:Multisite-specific tRNA:(cytosine-C(5))-methyltransferase [Candida viswanathii]
MQTRRFFSMAKKNFKKRNNRGNSKGFGKRPEKDDRWSEVVRENPTWESYYKSLGLIPESEWDEFKTACQTNLPMTFRITGSRKHAEEIRNIFLDRHVKHLEGKTFEGVDLTPKNIEFYPDQLGWQIDVSKNVIKKQKEYAKTQRFLVVETEVGNISRQEAVSMIPPLLLDVKPHHYVLDMCAAPGSKTAQLIESLHAEDEKALPTGFVLANDSDYKRSHMLVHQVKRLNSPNFLVVNHDATLFPRIKLNGSRSDLKFDRILCDVPCSGDATMRKNLNVWKDFRVGNALGLHSVQEMILNRGLQLLKKGGRLVYSTCSLSPIENEAIVASALRKWGDQIKLVNVDDELPGLKRRKGVSDWKVYGKDMELKEPGAEDVPATAFPPTKEEAEKFHLDNCVRVYPHLQNTGGFFITVFEKIDPQAGSETKRKAEESDSEEAESKKPKSEVTSDVSTGTTGNKGRMPRDANEEPFIFLDPENPELQKCYPFYGFNDKFPKDCALVRNATGEPLRTIYYTAPIIKEILSIEKQKLKLVHGGIKLFVAQRNDVGACGWRLQTESLHTIEHFVSDKRHVKCNLKLLEHLMKEGYPKIEDIKTSGVDPEFSERIGSIDEGCLILTVERGEGLENLSLPLWRGKTNVNLMVNKKDNHELLYRVFDVETKATDAGKELIHQKKVEAQKQAQREGSEAPSVVETTEQETSEQETPEVEAQLEAEAEAETLE